MTIPHEIIRASAGTGKTFALSDRIVHLLALGAAPETIVALTFTRKAAAEFASAVFRKLADAALSETAAHGLASRLNLGPRSAGDFAATLAHVIAAMNRLQFGTMDSFFQRAASTIPFELGLSGSLRVLDETGALDARREALEKLLHENVGASTRRTLLEAFRAATWGAEEKQLFPRLLGVLDSGHELFVEAPATTAWGDGEIVWPDGNPLLQRPGEIAEDTARAAEFALTCSNKRFGAALEKFARQAAAWQPGMDLPDGSIAEQLFSHLAASRPDGPLELTYYNKACVIPGTVVPYFQRIVRHCLGATLTLALRAARGMHHLIAGYDRIYENSVRRTGRLAFGDITEMLRRADPRAWQPRLDSRIAHWLFDEFQDTSTAQWAVLSGLVDEALQDPSNSRTVFFVGDPKQAIYRWRGGEHRLLARIAGYYGNAIAVRPLDRSFRSAPAVIDFVNRVGATACRCGDLLPSQAVEEWRAGWSDHVSAVRASEGFVQVQEVDARDKESLHDALLASLREVDPIGRGFTCAILTRGNEDAAEIARGLRERGFFDIAAETDVSITTDQPLTQSLLAVISAAAHPADSPSRRLVEMSPLAACLARAGGWSALRIRVLRAIATAGFETTLLGLLSEIPEAQPSGRFGRLRLSQLLEVARKCDAGDRRDPREFVRLAREAIRRETASASRVQVMTIHKAKGLGFDFVLLPMRTNRRLDAVESDLLLVSRDADHKPRWIIGRPPSAVIDADPTLRQAQEMRRVDAAYESLCVLYVALTRARFGLHVFIPPPSSSSSTLSAADLVRRAAADAASDGNVIWRHGDARWFEKTERMSPKTPEMPRRADWSAYPKADRLIATLPSRAGGSVANAEALAQGAAIHAAFARIDWLDETMPRATDKIGQIVQACLAEPEIAALFRKPSAAATTWRERAFDVVLEDRWVSGVFDRVILDESSATLIEFKTGLIDAPMARERHARQIALYRAALQKLTGMKTIRAVIVLTRTREVVEM